MIIGVLAPVGKIISISLSDSTTMTGFFNNHDYPFASFTLADSMEEMHIHLDHIVSVIAPEENSDGD